MTYKKSNLALVVPPPQETESDADASPANRRAHQRLTVSELAWLNNVRLKYGPHVSLLDLSSGGAQFETTGHPLQPGTPLVLEIAGEHGAQTIPARVVRCHISSIAPQPTYRGAVAFKRPVELPQNLETPGDAEANPLHEHARLSATLRRSAGPDGGIAPECTAALAALRTALESTSARRAGDAFARPMARLMKAATRSIERGDAAAMVAELAEGLRRLVPARAIQLIDAAAAATVRSTDAIAFDIPSSASRLLVEFPQAFRPEAWHLLLLRGATHLFTIAIDVERTQLAAAERMRREEMRAARPGWHRLVARYLDGRVLKGYTRDFSPPRGQIQVWPDPDCPADSRIVVPLAQLKAVFYVHDLDGLSNLPEPPSGAAEPGRTIVVTFADGEVLTGTTLTYSANAPGFFVSPADTTTNNVRVFVVASALARVHFP